LEYLKDVEREGIRSAEIFIAKSKTYFSGEQGCSFCAGMDRQMACVADGYQKELAKANERLEALNAELSKVRRNPFTNLYLFCAWHLSREIQGLAPILSRSFIERMKRREKKISPESLG